MKTKSGDKKSPKCSFFIKRKSRTCKFQASKDSEYCTEHLALNEDVTAGDVRKRIPCPRDPKHSVFESKLKQHLRKCNVVKLQRSLEAEEGYAKNINSPDPYEEDDKAVSQVTLRSVPTAEVLSLIERVGALYNEYKVEIREDILSHDALKEEMATPGFGPAALKHLKQLASLLGQMDNMLMLHGNTCYVEFGAGKGQLSYWVQQALSKEKDPDFLLIDRAGNRHKLDGQHRDDGGCVNSHRLKMDIEHLDLGRVPCIKNQEKPIVGMSKHLCGAATDLCLRCVVNTLQLPSSQDTSPAAAEGKEPKLPRLEAKTGNRSRLQGLIIALCCHHKGNWHHYCGKEFFKKCGLTARDYHIIQSLGSWAVCGVRKVPETDHERAQEEQAELEDDKDERQQPRFDQFSHEEREEIGRQCKRLIDIGRIKYLESVGYRVVLKKYVSEEVTLENVVMIVVPEDIKDS
ncbi:tRNA:m(4)X modification enzyme TRM13 homolog [Lineus longissimus]|uniref:tRNA:m(4)X modification enzyme TRM13 homolog n=1 Tax=Lineus longissimus TaxID=88925 RepID=UPI00315CF182